MRILKANNSAAAIANGAAISSALSNSGHDNIQGDLFFNADEILANSESKQRNLQRGNNKTNESFVVRRRRNVVDDSQKELNRLRGKAIRLLSMREHSSQEIVTKLSVGDASLTTVHTIVDELIENNYLCDSRFTECFVRSKQNRGFGPSKIASELKLKGINNKLVNDYLNANSSIWFEVARAQYLKKYGDEPVKDYNTWAKRARFMQSRGFGMGHIQATLPTIESD